MAVSTSSWEAQPHTTTATHSSLLQTTMYEDVLTAFAAVESHSS